MRMLVLAMLPVYMGFLDRILLLVHGGFPLFINGLRMLFVIVDYFPVNLLQKVDPSPAGYGIVRKIPARGLFEMEMVVLLLIVLLVPFATVLWLYNRLVQLRNMKDEAWSGIDVQLKRRNDLVPNLVETVKGYAGHERTLFENVARIRSSCLTAPSLKDRSDLETEMTHSIRSLFAVAENYPHLLANQNFMALQKNLTDLEDEIQMARRYYNGSVRNFNSAVESFPGNLVAALFHFKTAEFFALETLSDRAVPGVTL